MSAPTVRRHLGATLLLALALSATRCANHRPPAVVSHSPSAPVYPDAKLETVDMNAPGTAAGQAFSTDNSFDAVYAWYKKNLPEGSQRSVVTSPQKAAVFLVGPMTNRLSVTITSSPLCCKTLIVIAQAS